MTSVRGKRRGFWSLVRKTAGCWLWTGHCDRKGYGFYGRARAHRRAYEESRGKIPTGLQIDHLCREHGCVNPDHLEAVTQQENMRRGYGASAVNARRVRCTQGHRFTRGNTRLDKHGHRRCRRCTTENVRRWRRAHGVTH